MLWFKKGADEKGQILSEILVSTIHKVFSVVADELHTLGYMTEDERIELSNLIGNVLANFKQQFNSKVPNLVDKNVKTEDVDKLNEKI